MTKPPAVYLAGLLRRLGDRDLDRGLGLALDPGGPAALLPAERRPAGTTTAGSTPRPSSARWNMAGARSQEAHAPSRPHPPGHRPRRSRQARRQRGLVLGRAADPGDPRLARLVRPQGDGRCDRRRRPPEGVPADDAERAPPPRRRLAGDADLMSNGCHHCDEFSRASLLRRAVAEAGKGLPAIEPGMPAPAGTGHGPPPVPLAHARCRADRLRRRRRSGRVCSTRASPALRSRPRRAAACSSRSSRRAAGTRSRSSTRSATRATASCAPRSRSRPGDGPAFGSDHRLHWHPVARAARHACTPAGA